MASNPTSTGPPSSSKKRGIAGAFRIRKRTRNSRSNQDTSGNDPTSLRGGRGSFTPAAGTWQRPTAQDPNQNRLFSNLGRVPPNAGLGIPAPARPITQTPIQVERTAAGGAQIGPAGLTPGATPAAAGSRTANVDGSSQGTTPTPFKWNTTTGTMPSPGSTPAIITRKASGARLNGQVAPLNGPGPESGWEYPDPRWNTDRQIIDGWKALEGLIASYVQDVIVDSIPDIETTHNVYPFEAFFRLSDLAIPMVRNKKYAKYIFQVSIWNILNEKFLGHISIEWACEERGNRFPLTQRTKGLAAAMAVQTYGRAIDRKSTMLRREREKWYMWRKDTVDFVYGWLSQHADYEQTVDNAIFDILTMYQGYIEPAYAGGDRDSWDSLIERTSEIVMFATRLSIMMRRSRDGTWSPFIPSRGQVAMPEAIIRHQDTAMSLPPGQDDIRADSRITATVVPGLSKYEITDVDDDPARPGEKNTAIRKKVRMKAKCLIDITEAETGPKRDGDVWIAYDI